MGEFVGSVTFPRMVSAQAETGIERQKSAQKRARRFVIMWDSPPLSFTAVLADSVS
jgi:hypothetical protein